MRLPWCEADRWTRTGSADEVACQHSGDRPGTRRRVRHVVVELSSGPYGFYRDYVLFPGKRDGVRSGTLFTQNAQEELELVAIPDLNGDGNDELWYAFPDSLPSPTVGLLSGGVLTVQTGGSIDVATGDFDGDGIADRAVLESNGTLGVTYGP